MMAIDGRWWSRALPYGKCRIIWFDRQFAAAVKWRRLLIIPDYRCPKCHSRLDPKIAEKIRTIDIPGAEIRGYLGTTPCKACGASIEVRDLLAKHITAPSVSVFREFILAFLLICGTPILLWAVGAGVGASFAWLLGAEVLDGAVWGEGIVLFVAIVLWWVIAEFSDFDQMTFLLTICFAALPVAALMALVAEPNQPLAASAITGGILGGFLAAFGAFVGCVAYPLLEWLLVGLVQVFRRDDRI